MPHRRARGSEQGSTDPKGASIVAENPWIGGAGSGPGGTGLRSYGSLTYTGFKSMLYAGLSKKDPRVQAAYQWIRSHWDLDANPNMPGQASQEGLSYLGLFTRHSG